MDKKSIWFIVVCVLFALLWLQAETRYRQLREELQALYVREVILQTVDEKTGEPVPVVLGTSGTGPENPLPKLRIQGTNETSSMRLLWAGTDRIPVRVSSDGYEEQLLHLDAIGESKVIVRLRHKKAN